MQTFRTKFTTDMSQHRRAMGMFRQQTCSAIGDARNQLMMLSGLTVGGISFGNVVKDTIKLGAEMEKTRVAFDVMLGSAEASKRVISDLMQFSDVTPFEPDEVIKAGRGLLAANVQTSDLTRKLDFLGNIASGTGSTLGDMVSIYMKAANKGKVQAEELNQLAERGVPIYAALSQVIGVNTAEIAKMGERGELSFALLENALVSLGGQGGKYGGLMAKQSQTLDGLLSTLRGKIKLIGTTIGELAIPQLSQNVADLIDKIEQMKKSGELDIMMGKASTAIIQAAAVLKDFVGFIVTNRDTIASLGFTAAGLIAIKKAGTLVLWLQGVIAAVRADQAAKAIAAANTEVAAAESASAREIAIATKTAAVREAMAAKTAMVVAQFYAKETAAARASAAAKLAAEQAKGVPTATAVNSYALATQNNSSAQKGLMQASMAVRRTEAAAIEAEKALANMPVQATAKIGLMAKSVGALKLTLANLAPVAMTAFAGWQIGRALDDMMGLEKAAGETAARFFHGVKRNPEGKQTDADLADHYEKNIKGRKNDKVEYQGSAYGYIAYVRKREAVGKAAIAQKKKEEEAEKDYIAVMDQCQRDLDAQAAVEKIRQDKLDKITEAKQKASEELKKIARERADIAFDTTRDAMNDKIEQWRENINQYSKQIDAVEKKLSRFGSSVDEDILKTPEQIAQDKKDDLLKLKISAANKGEKVSFTAEERDRINSLRQEQLQARDLKKQSSEMSDMSEESGKTISKMTRERASVERNERVKILEDREKTASAITKTAENAAPDMEIKKLTPLIARIEEILKKGLPSETI